MLGNAIDKIRSRKPLKTPCCLKDDRQSSGFLDNERNDIVPFRRGAKQEAQPAEAKSDNEDDVQK